MWRLLSWLARTLQCVFVVPLASLPTWQPQVHQSGAAAFPVCSAMLPPPLLAYSSPVPEPEFVPPRQEHLHKICSVKFRFSDKQSLFSKYLCLDIFSKISVNRTRRFNTTNTKPHVPYQLSSYHTNLFPWDPTCHFPRDFQTKSM
jgi:hypothetical protein